MCSEDAIWAKVSDTYESVACDLICGPGLQNCSLRSSLVIRCRMIQKVNHMENYECTTLLTLILSGLEINTWTNSSSASCVWICGPEGEGISCWNRSSGTCICPCWPLLTVLGACTTPILCLVCACCWSAALTVSLFGLVSWL